MSRLANSDYGAPGMVGNPEVIVLSPGKRGNQRSGALAGGTLFQLYVP